VFFFNVHEADERASLHSHCGVNKSSRNHSLSVSPSPHLLCHNLSFQQSYRIWFRWSLSGIFWRYRFFVRSSPNPESEEVNGIDVQISWKPVFLVW